MFTHYEAETAVHPDCMKERIFILDSDGEAKPVVIPDDEEGDSDA